MTQIKKKKTVRQDLQGIQELDLGKYEKLVEERLRKWKEQSFFRRLWSKDPTIWFPGRVPEITNRLGWLTLPESMPGMLGEFIAFAREVKEEGFSKIVLLGMGGSSLAPEVLGKTFGSAPGFPELVVLDSTHPEAICLVEDTLDLPNTLFIVSSKSGTTLETLSLFRYFWGKVSRINDNPGQNFVAITDEGSPLHETAQERKFRRVFTPPADVGGRYSAFTDFGLLPAALIGIDVHRLLDRARIAMENCAFCVPEAKASASVLGAALGELTRKRDKLTIVTSPSLASFPSWLEQLIAESTGKEGRGIVPVADEPMVSVRLYGKDRMWAFIFLEGDENRKLEGFYKAVKKAGHPAIRITLKDAYDLGREMYCWEVAVASAGAVIGIHPFNQPDVQLAKDFTREAMKKVKAFIEEEVADGKAFSLKNINTVNALKELLSFAEPGTYIALQAYLAPLPEMTEALQRVRVALLTRKKVATTLGYGPRFLHSTGQLHKGGPNKGLFLQVIDEPKKDIPVPETDYTFGELIRGQSLGDYRALIQRERRVVRINAGDEARDGLNQLAEIIHKL